MKTRKETYKMVKEWIVANKRPMTADDAKALATTDDGFFSLDALLWIRDVAHYFATEQSEEQFKVQNNFDAKFNVGWLYARHGPQPYLYEC